MMCNRETWPKFHEASVCRGFGESRDPLYGHLNDTAVVTEVPLCCQKFLIVGLEGWGERRPVMN